MLRRRVLGPALSLVVGATMGLAFVGPAESAGGHIRVTYKLGKLTVVGSNSANRIRIVRKASTVVVKVDGRKIDVGKRISPTKLKRIRVRGLDGNDQLLLIEKAGPLPNARIQGGKGDDFIQGGSGANRLLGRGGNDVIVGGPGTSIMDGGIGDDQLRGGSGPATMIGDLGNDTITAGAGITTMDGGEGDDNLTGGPAETKMDGGAGLDRMLGGSGATTMRGGGGNDVMAGGIGPTTLVGGGGDDTMSGGTGGSDMNGGTGGDVMTGGSGINDMKGEEGDDVMTGGSGPNTMSGGINNDVLVGGSNVNNITGDDGADHLVGGPLTDRVSGAAGPDLLLQSPGGDQLNGGDGDDVFQLDADAPGGAVTLTESVADGVDTIDLSSTTSVDLVLNLADGVVQTLSPSLSVKLSEGDTFDRVVGGPGLDEFGGNRLDNIISGGAQDDVIEGRAGNDTVRGGAGPDTFAFRKAAELLGNDQVSDFGVGLDTVDLTDLLVKSGLGTTIVTLWDGISDFGTITATNGHNWAASDFS